MLKKVKFDIISNHVNKNYDVDLAVLQFDMFMLVILQIKPMSNSLLYVEFVVVFLMFMLTNVQLSDDVLLYAPMTTTLMSLVAIAVITNMMYLNLLSLLQL